MRVPYTVALTTWRRGPQLNGFCQRDPRVLACGGLVLGLSGDWFRFGVFQWKLTGTCFSLYNISSGKHTVTYSVCPLSTSIALAKSCRIALHRLSYLNLWFWNLFWMHCVVIDFQFGVLPQKYKDMPIIGAELYILQVRQHSQRPRCLTICASTLLCGFRVPNLQVKQR